MIKIEIRKKKIINKNYAEDAVVCQTRVKIKKNRSLFSLSSQERNPIIFSVAVVFIKLRLHLYNNTFLATGSMGITFHVSAVEAAELVVFLCPIARRI
jgi:hypothetical protein